MASYKAFRQSGHIPTLFAAFLYFDFSFAVWVLKRSDGAVDLLQLVPLRWPATTAVAGSMIIEIGALGGSILPQPARLSKQHTGSYASGFVIYTALALLVLIMVRVIARRWTRTWVGEGGRALATQLVKIFQTFSHISKCPVAK